MEQLYRREGRRLWWALMAYTGDEEVSSDAEAEAFAQAIARGEGLTDPRAWIWKVAFRVAAGELKRRRLTDHEVPDLADPRALQAHELVSLLRRLPVNQREALVLRYYADREVSEIGTIMGIAPATVRVHLFRGRRRLMQLLEDDR
jgi:RNA polymerase sigma factor (sigma-70 family)